MNKLKTPENMYWHIRQHLMTQGRKARNGGSTNYFGEDGCRCSAGCMLPKTWAEKDGSFDAPEFFRNREKVDEFLDKYRWTVAVAPRGSVTTNARLIYYHKIPLTKKNLQLLCDLEKVHENYPVEKWEARLDAIAIKYKLCDVIIAPKATATLPKKNATLREIVGNK